MFETSSIEEELKAGRAVIFDTRGVSMHPLLWQGKTQVLIEPLKRPLEVGDLPLVKLRPGLFRLHRLIRMDQGWLYTRGDNCIHTEKVHPAQVLGMVTRVYRGKWTLNLNSYGYRIYTMLWLSSGWLRIPIYQLRQQLYRVIRKTSEIFGSVRPDR